MNLLFFLHYVFLFYFWLKLLNAHDYVLFMFINTDLVIAELAARAA